MGTIELSNVTYRRLLARVESFEDTAEQVIERLLDATDPSATGVPDTPRRGRRASPGSILPEGEYWAPLLAVIEEGGGSLPANDAIEAVGERLKERLTERDFEAQRLGEVRWRNRVRFARLRMKERGLLSADSPRGVWQITEEGRRYLRDG